MQLIQGRLRVSPGRVKRMAFSLAYGIQDEKTNVLAGFTTRF